MKHLVIDTETTGLSPRYNKVLTVGMLLIEVDNNSLNILDQNHIFVKHKIYNSNPLATKIHKIDIKEHDKIAISPKFACKKINDFVEKNSLNDVSLIGHNIGFDKSFLAALFDQGESLSHMSTESIDTMHFWNSLKKEKIVPSDLRSKLQTLADYFEIDYTKAHDALADCHITAQVYYKMLGLKV